MRKRVLLAAVSAAALALAGCNASDILIQQFEVGQCVNFDQELTAEESEVGKLPVVSCTETHDGEVYFVQEVDADDYPATITDDAEAICYDEFQPYVGVTYEESTLDVTYLYPSSETWAIGDKDVVCLIVPFENPLPLESVKDSNL